MISLALLCGLLLSCLGLLRQALRLRATLRGLRTELRQLRREAAQLRLATDHASDGILLKRADGTIAWMNPAYERLMGRPAAEMLGRHPLSFALPEAERPPEAELAAYRLDPEDPNCGKLQLHRNVRGDGSLFWNQTSTALRRAEGDSLQAVVVCRDVTEQIQHAEKLRDTRRRLEHAASHDPLTGVANRAELMRRLRAALDAACAGGQPVGLLHVDLDLFKEINDTHGHQAGDAALCHVAETMTRVLREGDLVARIGGDEFMAVCSGLPDLEALRAVAAELTSELRHPFRASGRELRCGASIGVALADGESQTTEALILRADLALYEAKRLGRGRVAAYDGTLHLRRQRQLRRGDRLRRAIEQDELRPLFLPVCDAQDGRLLGYETRLSWTDPGHGRLGTADLMALAADLGLAIRLELACLGHALDLLRDLHAAGRGDLYLTFNATDAVLQHPDFLPALTGGVAERGLPPQQVVIDVGETTLFDRGHGTPAQRARIAELREAGFPVMLDRFGGGCAGLGQLAALPVNGIKLDSGLVRAITEDAISMKIVGMMLELCADLGFAAVAEGVETEAVAARLKALGCRYASGARFGKPLSRDTALARACGDRTRSKVPAPEGS